MKHTIDRVLNRVERIPFSGCWVFTGAINHFGYGIVGLQNSKKIDRTHRVAYRHFKGEIPTGLVIDHICRNPACVNPRHLQAISQSDNIKRSLLVKMRGARTHCKHGHEFTPENTKYVKGQRGRRCAKCLQISKAKSRGL